MNTCSLKMSASETQDVGTENQIIVILLINGTLLPTAESLGPFSLGINPLCSLVCANSEQCFTSGATGYLHAGINGSNIDRLFFEFVFLAISILLCEI